MSAHRKKRGVVLVTAVVFTAFLAALVVAGALYMRDGLGLVAIGRDEVRSEGLIRAGVEMTGGLMVTNASFIGDGQPYAFSLGEGRVEVFVVSEDGKIDLNKAEPQLLEGLFYVLGANRDEAKSIAEQIVAWRDPRANQSLASQAEAFRQNRAEVPQTRRLFRHPADLRFVPGIPPKRVEQALPYVTVLSKSGTICALCASETVLAALPGISIQLAREIVKLRRGSAAAWDAIRPLLGNSVSYAREDGGTAFSLLIEAELDRGYKQAAEVVIVAAGEREIPYRVVSWNSGSAAEAKISTMRLSSR